MVVGIDPGQKGAVVTLSPSGTIVDARPMPDLSELAGYLQELVQWSRHEHVPVHVWLEKAQSMPKQGIASAFNYGRHFGELLGAVVTLGLPHTLVPSSTWTKTMHAGTAAGDAKTRSLEAARRLAPQETFKVAHSRAVKPHDGLVDAFLIAGYGRRQLLGGAV